jgi:hypothetical protein
MVPLAISSGEIKMPLHLNPETVALLSEVLDDAWDSLPPLQKATMRESDLAVPMLESAAKGERNRERLRDAALMALAA